MLAAAHPRSVSQSLKLRADPELLHILLFAKSCTVNGNGSVTKARAGWGIQALDWKSLLMTHDSLPGLRLLSVTEGLLRTA